MPSIPVALQLYTVRDETARDFTGTLRRVAEIGYRAIEFAGYGDLSADGMKKLLDETGLQVAATHVGLDALTSALDEQIAYCTTIGCSYLVLPWLSPDKRSPETLRALAPQLNEIGRRCREHNITFAYHNHDFEFQEAGGAYLLDTLLDDTDPNLVKSELDSYWAAYAGVDPVAYIRRRAGRIALVHLKDMTPDRTFTEVGDGTLDIKGICAAAAEAGAQWFVVENDQPQMPSLESARRSLENLRALGIAG